MNFNYHVITNFPQLGGAETEVRTNDIYQALDIYLDEVQNGNPTLIMDGHTAEVVAIANHDGIEDHTNLEFGLIIRGYLATLAAEEEELMAEEEESFYPNSSMVLHLNNGDEVIVLLSKEQMGAVLNGDGLADAVFII